MRMHDQGSNHIPSSTDFPTGNLAFMRGNPSYLYFIGLSKYPGLVHAIFTRKGGISPVPFSSLNVSMGVGDDPYNVVSNLKNIKKQIGAKSLVHMDQIHSDNIIEIRQLPSKHLSNAGPGDAMITHIPGVVLMVKQADCQGVIIYDPVKKALAVVHCGWRGNVKNILAKTVRRMVQAFGSDPSMLHAAISPSLGPCCGEFKGWEKIFPEEFTAFKIKRDYFDLWQISKWQLMGAGLKPENIELGQMCTKCNTDMFFSYRGEGRTGRFGTIAMIIN